MLIGLMNDPRHELIQEIEKFAAMGFQFLDLTLEPPKAASWEVDPKAIRAALERNGLKVVGHTPFYLPMASAIKEIRAAAVTELRRCMEVFAEVGARWMNIHPDRYTPMHDRAFYIRNNIDSLEQLLPVGEKLGVGLMIENLPGDYNNQQQLGDLLDALPELGLHLDFGHANLMVPRNTAEEILHAFGDRLRHVHLHDNKGGHADLHLPLGTGEVDVRNVVRLLKHCHYEGTITLEVFTPDPHHVEYSRDLLKKTWEEVRV